MIPLPSVAEKLTPNMSQGYRMWHDLSTGRPGERQAFAGTTRLGGELGAVSRAVHPIAKILPRRRRRYRNWTVRKAAQRSPLADWTEFMSQVLDSPVALSWGRFADFDCPSQTERRMSIRPHSRHTEEALTYLFVQPARAY